MVWVLASTISNNAGNGLSGERTTLIVDQGSVVSNNQNGGLVLTNGSSATLGNATISNNNGAGLWVHGASSVRLGPSAAITENIGNGIWLQDGGWPAGVVMTGNLLGTTQCPIGY